jgi:hypothetical protein
LTQNAIASVHAFCHCSANCIQNCEGFATAIWKAPASGQLPAGLTLGKDFSFDSIADGPTRLLALHAEQARRVAAEDLLGAFHTRHHAARLVAHQSERVVGARQI